MINRTTITGNGNGKIKKKKNCMDISSDKLTKSHMKGLDMTMEGKLSEIN